MRDVFIREDIFITMVESNPTENEKIKLTKKNKNFLKQNSAIEWAALEIMMLRKLCDFAFYIGNGKVWD